MRFNFYFFFLGIALTIGGWYALINYNEATGNLVGGLISLIAGVGMVWAYIRSKWKRRNS